ncbi:hypothetical protein HYV85_06620 [Candidatus Woesearchaeota archaeon]|nr:hypothetical protein [Candidatus Woesearchaeota archaeon]
MERNIQVVYVTLKKLRITHFSAAEQVLGISILLNDGKDRELNWNSRIAEPKLMAAKLLSELMAREEGEHTDFDGESLTNSPVVLLHEQASTEAALVDFFQTLYSKACRIKNATKSDGYLSMVADIRRTELVL